MKQKRSRKQLVKPSRKITLIFILMAFTNILINIDHGIIPAGKTNYATLQIEKSLNLDNTQLGYLGSLVYAGIVTVSLLAGKILKWLTPRTTIIFSYVGMILFLSAFTIKYPSDWPYFVSRYFTGVAQAPILIYFPVWVDNFGQSSKTIWLSILQGGVPVGIFTGYVISSIISNLFQWQYSFFIQIALLIPSFVIFLFIPADDFNITNRLRRLSRKQSLNGQDTQQGKKRRNSDTQDQSQSYFSTVRLLLQSRVTSDLVINIYQIWICVALGISVLYFTVTGIQFWMTNYMEMVLGDKPLKTNTAFAVISITAPILGCIFGGTITQITGGYESKVALKICLINCTFACMSSVPIPFLNSFWAVSVLIWLLLFFGGALVPPLTGIMLTSVQPQLRAFANANNTMLYNLLGFLPAPSVYGYLSTLGPRVGMLFLMFYPLVGLILIAIATYEKSNQLESQPISKNNSLEDQGKNIGLEPLEQLVEKSKSSSITNLSQYQRRHITQKVFVFNQIPLTKSITSSFQKEDFQRLFSEDDILSDSESESGSESDYGEGFTPTDI